MVVLLVSFLGIMFLDKESKLSFISYIVALISSILYVWGAVYVDRNKNN